MELQRHNKTHPCDIHYDTASNGGRFFYLGAVADPARGRGACPPLAAWQFFRQYINIITKPTAYDGPWEY